MTLEDAVKTHIRFMDAMSEEWYRATGRRLPITYAEIARIHRMLDLAKKEKND